MGAIESGDADRLESQISGVIQASYQELDPQISSRTVCLESDGGSYEEGWRFFNLFVRNGVSTFVEHNKRCLSACAIAFLGGTEEFGAELSRQIESGAVLGFHAPFAQFEERSYKKSEMDSVFAAGTLIMSKILDESTKTTVYASRPYIRLSLIRQMLSKKPKEFYLIDTVGKAIRYNIGVKDDLRLKVADINYSNLINFCNSAIIEIFDVLPDDRLNEWVPDLLDEHYIKERLADNDQEYLLKVERDTSKYLLRIELRRTFGDNAVAETCYLSVTNHYDRLIKDAYKIEGCYVSETFDKQRCFGAYNLGTMIRRYDSKL